MKNIFNTKIVIAVSMSALFLSGCATTAIPYQYGNYSESYYSFKKEPGDESLLEWKNSMMKVIEESEESSFRVPPGIYANLGYLSLKQNNLDEALVFFTKEKQTYPQSTVFMDRLIEKTKSAKDGEKS